MGTDAKATQRMDIRDLPAFFRALADAMEHGNSTEYPDISGFKKFKITGKNEFGQVAVRVRFKSADACDTLEESETCEACRTSCMPKYKHLKKRMKSSFRLIFKTIHDGQPPPAAAVESFLADSELMITYPGYGDEYYARYAQACEAFRDAFAAGDMDAMGRAVDAIAHEKNRCHATYD